jgi:hypothetical protein
MSGSIFDSKGREILSVALPKPAQGLNTEEKAASVLAVTLVDAYGNPVTLDPETTIVIGLILDAAGYLNLPKDPIEPQHAATKAYVDAAAAAAAIAAYNQPHPTRMSTRTVGSSTGLTLSDGIVFAVAECSLTLPSAEIAGDGFLYIIKNRTIDADVSVSALQGLIEGQSSLTIKAGNSVLLASDGHDWFIL